MSVRKGGHTKTFAGLDTLHNRLWVAVGCWTRMWEREDERGGDNGKCLHIMDCKIEDGCYSGARSMFL